MTPSAALARALLGELVEQGVREIVLAPGSRSAPLAFEALRLERAGRVRLHVRVDERSAGFLALGLAKVSGDPVVVMCTSGTAVANLLPAVAEASYCAVPVVVVSADRPVEARGVAAPQTIDQIDLFGGMVRHFADLGIPRRVAAEDADGPLRAARSAAVIAIAAALGVPSDAGVLAGRVVAHRGPVHLNVGLRPPLVPEGSWPDPAEEGVALGGSVNGPPPVGGTGAGHRPVEPAGRLSARQGPALEDVLGQVPTRGVVLVGDLPVRSPGSPHEALSALAAACGWPLIVEPSASLGADPNALAHAALVLAADGFVTEHTPEVVVTAGLFGLSRPTLGLLARAARHVALDLPDVGREVCDPVRTATDVVSGVPRPPAEPQVDPTWLAAWRSADATAAWVVAEHLDAERLNAERLDAEPLDDELPESPAPPPLSEAVATRAALAALPDGCLLLAAASWPVRMVEAFAGAEALSRIGPIVGNRGANGIDGLVSTAWGAALAHGGPAVALLGDLAFLHDHNGLIVGPDEPMPEQLTLVVLDNGGGGIFHQLEQGRPEYADAFERIFGTPVRADVAALAAATEVPTEVVTTPDELVAAVRSSLAAGGVRVVVALVESREDEAALLERIRSEVVARIEAGLS